MTATPSTATPSTATSFVRMSDSTAEQAGFLTPGLDHFEARVRAVLARPRSI